MTSYSQYGEDIKIAELLREVKVGRLLDIGAWDPKIFSNSRALIEAGWEAILIEPSPVPLRALVAAYQGNEQVTVIGAAVVADERPLIRLRLSDDAVSSSDPAVQATWSKQGGYYGWVLAATVSIAELLNQFGGDCAFVSIDAEGASVDLALAYLAAGPRPRVMCVEHDGRLVEFLTMVGEYDYRAELTNSTNVVIAL